MTGDGYVWLVTQQTFSGVARNYVPLGEILDIRECVPVDSLACGNYNPGHIVETVAELWPPSPSMSYMCEQTRQTNMGEGEGSETYGIHGTR